MVTGNVRPYATSSSSGKADYVRPQTESQEEKLEETEEEDTNEEEVTVVLKTCHKSRKSRFFAEEEKALEERKGSKVKK